MNLNIKKIFKFVSCDFDKMICYLKNYVLLNRNSFPKENHEKVDSLYSSEHDTPIGDRAC